MSTTNLNGNTFAAAPTLPTGKSFSPNNETTTNGNETYANGNTTTMNMNGSARMNSFEEVLNGKNELKQQETAAPEVQDEYQGNYEPMAIVSMACRFPGDSSSPEKLWELLMSEKRASNKIPSHRFNTDAFYHPRQDRPGSILSLGGYFIADDVRDFDPSFFNINPIEGASIDPQQRKILEVVYECFENAGLSLDDVSGEEIGCFLGGFTTDYRNLQNREGDYTGAYGITGGCMSILSNRVSFVFNLLGPSLVLNTACSSSLYALHTAARSIAAGECSAAIVGGTSIIISIEQHMGTSRLGVLSPTGVCHTFDESADGYSRAEGIGAIYIKKLRDAIRDGDTIRAVIRGSAMNSNGRTSGSITHPSAVAQEAVIRQAYRNAGITDFSLTSYMECHGTGTAIGDPTEARALSKVFAEGRSPEEPLLIGSIKSNIGHSEPTSGIAGIIKTVQALEKGVIPATVGIQNLTKKIKYDEWKLKVVTETTTWPDHYNFFTRPTLNFRRASVNSFGYGGANAHVILDSYEPALEHRVITPPPSASLRSNFLLLFSGHDNVSLKQNIAALQKNIQKVLKDERQQLVDVAYSLSKRSRFTNRAFAVTGAQVPSQEWLAAEQMTFGTESNEERGLTFVFPGQGAQWALMGKELMDTFPSYLATLRSMDKVMQRLEKGPQWHIEDALREGPKTSKVNEPEYSQPLCTAVQVALVDLLATWGIKPNVTVGHSSGEIAAAYAAGLISREDAITVAYYRGIGGELLREGAMLAVGLGPREVRGKVQDWEGRYSHRLVEACHNSPLSTTLSGDPDAIDEIAKELTDQGIFARRLKTGGRAYHSHIIRESGVGVKYEELIGKYISRKKRNISKDAPVMVSSVTGSIVDEYTVINARYWRKNLESPVLFSEAFGETLQMNENIIIEIGPHSALAGPIKQIRQKVKPASKAPYIASLKRNENSVGCMLQLAGTLFLNGYSSVDIARVNAIETFNASGELEVRKGRLLHNLPNYQWNYTKKHWTETRTSVETRQRVYPRHDLLGSRTPGLAEAQAVWRNSLKLKDVPWIKDHVVQGEILYPGAAFLSMAVEATTQFVEERDGRRPFSYTLRNCTVRTSLHLANDNSSVDLVTIISPMHVTNRTSSMTHFHFEISSVQEGVHKLHCIGTIVAGLWDDENPVVKTVDPRSQSPPEHPASRANHDWHQVLRDAGYSYGPTFSGLHDISISEFPDHDGYCKMPLQLENGVEGGESRYIIHPTAMDCSIQCAILAAHSGFYDDPEVNTDPAFDRCLVPVDIEEIIYYDHNAMKSTAEMGFFKAKSEEIKSAEVHARAEWLGLRSARLKCEVYDSEGALVFQVKGIRAIAIETMEDEESKKGLDVSPYNRIVWQADVEELLEEGAGDVEKQFATISPVAAQKSLAEEIVQKKLEILAQLVLKKLKITTVGRTEELINSIPASKQHLQYFVSWLRNKLRAMPLGNADIESINAAFEAELSQLRSEVGDFDVNSIQEIKLLKALIHIPLANMLASDLPSPRIGLSGPLAQVGKVMELLSHKAPQEYQNVLIIGWGAPSSSELAAMLKGIKEYIHDGMKFTYAYAGPAGVDVEAKSVDVVLSSTLAVSVAVQQLVLESQQEKFDVVVAIDTIHRFTSISTTLQKVAELIKSSGRFFLVEQTKESISSTLIQGLTSPTFYCGRSESRLWSPFLNKDTWVEQLYSAGFDNAKILSSSKFTLYAATNGSTAAVVPTTQSTRGELVVVYRAEESRAELVERLLPILSAAYRKVTVTSLAESNTHSLVKPSTTILMATDLEKSLSSSSEHTTPLLSNIDDVELTSLQYLIANCSTMIWLTNGSLLSSNAEDHNPYHSMAAGMLRSLAREDLSIKLYSIDLDAGSLSASSVAKTAKTMSRVLQKITSSTNDSFKENEMAISNGVVHVSRFVSDKSLNEEFRSTMGKALEPKLELREEGYTYAMKLGKVGLLDTISFVKQDLRDVVIGDEQVEVEVKATGFNMKNLAIVTGRYETTDHFSLEVSGIVHRIGKNVNRLKVGDRVAAVSLANYDTYQLIPEDCCVKVDGDYTWEELTTMPVVYSTAVYAFENIANLQPGETVLVQAASGGAGMAAVQVAQAMGAEVFITCSPEKQAYCSEKLHVPMDHVFNSRDSSFIDGILAATNGRGVDVIYNTSMGESMHDTWRKLLARFGRMVDIARADAMAYGQLDMSPMMKNTLFASFDLGDIYKERTKLMLRLMNRWNQLLQEGKISPITPITSFDLSELKQCCGQASRAQHMGKIVLSYEDPSKPLMVQPVATKPRFDSNGIYLMVGCLGGLGSSLSKLMIKNGAREFIFLSRSGSLESPKTKAFVDELMSKGARVVEIIQGDVSKKEDILEALGGYTSEKFSRVRGVVNAAMVLQDGPLATTTTTRLRTCLEPKVSGSMNLHEVFSGSDAPAPSQLDFFLMTSSVVGIGGSAMQSNYGAANAFQDSLATLRRKMGLSATSLAIGMIVGIGHVAEHAIVLENLTRNGYYGIYEREFNRMISDAIVNDQRFKQDGASASNSAHLITGLDPTRIYKDRASVDEFDTEARYAHMALSWSNYTATSTSSSNSTSTKDSPIQGITTQIKAYLALPTPTTAAKEELTTLVAVHISNKINQLMMLDPTPEDEQVDMARFNTSLMRFGLDSMLSAELRNWLFKEFRADVRVMEMIANGLSVWGLSVEVLGQVLLREREA